MLTLPTLQAAVCDGADFLWVATRAHLGHQRIRVGRLVAGMGVCKLVPVISKDLFEDTPVSDGWCHHRFAPHEGDQMVVVKRFDHDGAALSTPQQSAPGRPRLARSSLSHGDFWDRKNANSLYVAAAVKPPCVYFSLHSGHCGTGPRWLWRLP